MKKHIAQICTLQHASKMYAASVLAIGILLASCGGGIGDALTCTEAPPRTFTTAQVQAMTASDVMTLTEVELVNIGTNIQYLSNNSLAALRNTVVNLSLMCPHKAQLESITPAQIGALSPAQVRYLGSAATGVSQIAALNLTTFSTLVANSNQVGAITVPEMATIPSEKFLLIGSNFVNLSDPVLASLKETVITSPINTLAQIYAITPSQIDTLTPARAQLLGSAETGVPKLEYLNPNTLSRLLSNPQQASALTAQEVANFNSTQFSLIGTNLNLLSNQILASLKPTFNASPTNNQSQIAAITPAEIARFSPAQVRVLGSFDNGISKINFLSTATFIQLASDPAQVAAITPTEITTFYTDKIKDLGTNINLLSDAALANFNFACPASVASPQCQVQSIDFAQVPAFSQNQIMIFAAMNGGKGVSNFSTTAFGGLTPTQVTLLLPSHILNVTPAQLAALSGPTLGAFQPATIAAFTPGQKSLLSNSQHTACGC
jgi:trimeric autotransporter adhesin